MNSDQFQSLIRHAITTAGAYLVTNGVISGSQLSDAAGALSVLAMIAWSIYQKRNSAKTAKAVATVNAAAATGAIQVIPGDQPRVVHLS